MTTGVDADLLARGAKEWLRRCQDRERQRRSQRPKRGSTMIPPTVPGELLDPERWETADVHLDAIRDWIGDDPDLMQDAGETIEQMANIRRLSVSRGGSGNLSGQRLNLRFTLQQAKADPPQFNSADHAIEVARPLCREWTPEQYLWHFGNLPQDLLPVALHLLADDMADETVARLVFPTWTWSGRPERYIGRSDWRRIFRRAGFTVDGEPATAPVKGSRVLYRAADNEHRFNFSWTSKYWSAALYMGLRRAQFADGSESARSIRIWVMLAPSQNLLAFANTSGEHEWVVDTSQVGKLGRSLPIRLLDDPPRPRRSHWPHCANLSRTPGRCRECGAIVDGRSVADPTETLHDAFFRGRRGLE